MRNGEGLVKLRYWNGFWGRGHGVRGALLGVRVWKWGRMHAYHISHGARRR